MDWTDRSRRMEPNLRFERTECTWRVRLHLRKAGGTILLLTAGVACDPAFHLNGTVKTPAGAAVAGARVRFSCDGVVLGEELKTQSNGSFDNMRVGWYEDDCVVRIDAEGYEPKELPIGRYCRERSTYREGACIHVLVDTTVEPSNLDGLAQ